MLAYSHTIFIKASVLLENGAKEVRGRGQKYTKTKTVQETEEGTSTNFITHSIFWNFGKCPFPLFCRWFKS